MAVGVLDNRAYSFGVSGLISSKLSSQRITFISHSFTFSLLSVRISFIVKLWLVVTHFFWHIESTP